MSLLFFFLLRKQYISLITSLSFIFIIIQVILQFRFCSGTTGKFAQNFSHFIEKFYLFFSYVLFTISDAILIFYWCLHFLLTQFSFHFFSILSFDPILSLITLITVLQKFLLLNLFGFIRNITCNFFSYFRSKLILKAMLSICFIKSVLLTTFQRCHFMTC